MSVAPERLERWLTGFAERHGTTVADMVADRVAGRVAGREEHPAAKVRLSALDGSVAEVDVPFPPLTRSSNDLLADLVQHVCLPRLIGVLLVRRGGFATGVFQGATLLASKVGSRHVQGRSAAGGWSQQRFARRREAQAKVAYGAAAEAAAGVLLPRSSDLSAVVLGGDRASVQAVMADPRLSLIRPLVSGKVLDVPEPRRAVLDAAPGSFRAVSIAIADPPAGG